MRQSVPSKESGHDHKDNKVNTTLTTLESQQQTAAASHTLNVPAIRGKMGNTQYFTANFPMGMVVRLFTYDPERMMQLPVEQRSQRALKKSRIPEIADYMQEADYFFSSLTVSVDADWLEFVPSDVDENVGILRLPMETDWIINDGQHRVAGIAEAISRDHSLKSDNISVIVVADAGLQRTQQIFSDLNRTVLKTSKSLDILFDHRSPINRIATHVVATVPLFQGRIDKERVSLSSHSPMLATLNGIQQATASLLANVPVADLESDYDKYETLATDFWDTMSHVIAPWHNIAVGSINPIQARSAYVATYQMVIAAIGSLGGEALQNTPDWKKALAPLSHVEWAKANNEWQGLIMVGDEVVTRVTTRRALVEFLRYKVGFTHTKPKLPLRSKTSVHRGKAA